MSQKVVINDDFGGYGLSRKAFLRLRELGQKEALAEPDYGEYWADGSGPRKKLGGSDDDGSFGDKIPRDDPLLIQVVEELGLAANGFCASLKIITIPDGIEWEIEEYDGSEQVSEKHRSWQ